MRFSIGEPAENRFILPQFSPEASKAKPGEIGLEDRPRQIC